MRVMLQYMGSKVLAGKKKKATLLKNELIETRWLCNWESHQKSSMGEPNPVENSKFLNRKPKDIQTGGIMFD